ncbi:hypothetical protein BC936DRAFT_149891 [Jimgerdemannia flammicorona]|uniref:Bacterial shufflon protein N-terminal domain-containing protein n=1 Tax=Jimgerdemannia flammicorona TaxID=994334 RepID=A0A433DJQ3_9FUNG|nr:hypothetical protein BC936DRAFT_149891 [Jimgerdemannia flammicorona]
MKNSILFLATTLGASVVATPIHFTSNSAVENINPSGMQTAIAITINGNAVVSGSLRSNDRISTGEYVQIDGMANSGSDCHPNGLVGRDNNGVLFSCQFGVWQKVGGSINTVVRHNSDRGYRWPKSEVSCASHEKVMGGGSSCYQEGGMIWILKSAPSGNGWFTQCDGGLENKWGTAEVWVICAY